MSRMPGGRTSRRRPAGGERKSPAVGADPARERVTPEQEADDDRPAGQTPGPREAGKTVPPAPGGRGLRGDRRQAADAASEAAGAAPGIQARIEPRIQPQIQIDIDAAISAGYIHDRYDLLIRGRVVSSVADHGGRHAAGWCDGRCGAVRPGGSGGGRHPAGWQQWHAIRVSHQPGSAPRGGAPHMLLRHLGAVARERRA